jgi:Ni,Fe-hydrogenase I large subunit
METKNIRKYNSEYRKNLKQKISKLKNKNNFITIYNIVLEELDNKLTINRNGIYFNLNLLSDESIEKIEDIIKLEIEYQPETQKMIYETYNKNVNIDQFINVHKLTNQEKSLIKKYRSLDT